jgi:DNA-binding beta-propeller fold protein YncE
MGIALGSALLVGRVQAQDATAVASGLAVPMAVFFGAPGTAHESDLFVVNFLSNDLTRLSGASIDNLDPARDALAGSLLTAVSGVMDADGVLYFACLLARFRSDTGVVTVREISGSSLAVLDFSYEGAGFVSGIAVKGNQEIFVFNKQSGTITVIEFNALDPGANDNRSDVFAEGFSGGPEPYPNHIVLGPDDILYVADTGNRRIARVTDGGGVSTLIDGFNAPIGLALNRRGNLYVGDNGTGIISEVALDGRLLRTFETGVPSGQLFGITEGLDGEIFMAASDFDGRTGEVLVLPPPAPIAAPTAVEEAAWGMLKRMFLW